MITEAAVTERNMTANMYISLNAIIEIGRNTNIKLQNLSKETQSGMVLTMNVLRAPYQPESSPVG